MRRWARLIKWKTTITLLLLLSSMFFNSTATAANNTDNNVPPLLALVASLRHRSDAVQRPEAVGRSPPPSVVRLSRSQLAVLAPLMVADTLRAAKLPKTSRSRSQLFRERDKSQPKAGPSTPRAPSRQIRFLYPVGTWLVSCLSIPFSFHSQLKFKVVDYFVRELDHDSSTEYMCLTHSHKVPQ